MEKGRWDRNKINRKTSQHTREINVFFLEKKKRVNCSTITVLQTLFIRKLRILLLKEPQKVQRYVISNLSAPLMQKYCV